MALAVSEAGYMAFDGSRALLVGTYITPQSGPFAGQLGPWSSLVANLGIAVWKGRGARRPIIDRDEPRPRP